MNKKEKNTPVRSFVFDGQELSNRAYIEGGVNDERSFWLAAKHAKKIASESGMDLPGNAVFIRGLAATGFSWCWWIIWSPRGVDIKEMAMAEAKKSTQYATVKLLSEITEND